MVGPPAWEAGTRTPSCLLLKNRLYMVSTDLDTFRPKLFWSVLGMWMFHRVIPAWLNGTQKSNHVVYLDVIKEIIPSESTNSFTNELPTLMGKINKTVEKKYCLQWDPVQHQTIRYMNWSGIFRATAWDSEKLIIRFRASKFGNHITSHFRGPHKSTSLISMTFNNIPTWAYPA